MTSESANWYLVYTPDTMEVEKGIALSPDSIKLPKIGKQVFLAYISPIHYNAIVACIPSD